MKRIVTLLLISVLGAGLLACSHSAQNESGTGYVSISAEAAKQIMDAEEDCVILDVRTESEYAEGHIPGAIRIADSEITERAPVMLPDRDKLILVYCRSGRRSKNAAAELVKLGYTNIKEFGGIIDWPYETEKN